MSFLKRLIPMKAKVWIQFDKPAFQEGETVVGKVFIESNEYIRGEEVRVEARVFEHYSEMVQVRRDDQWVWERQEKKDTKFSRDVRIYGPADFGSGIRNFPFNVNIPTSKPTHTDGSIEYSLKGVVAVKGRPDVTGQTNLSFVPPAPMPVMVPASAPMTGFGQPMQPVQPFAQPLQQAQPSAQPVYQAPPTVQPGQQIPLPMQQAPPTVQPMQLVPQVVTREVVKVKCRYCETLADLSADRCPNCGSKL